MFFEKTVSVAASDKNLRKSAELRFVTSDTLGHMNLYVKTNYGVTCICMSPDEAIAMRDALIEAYYPLPVA